MCVCVSVCMHVCIDHQSAVGWPSWHWEFGHGKWCTVTLRRPEMTFTQSFILGSGRLAYVWVTRSAHMASDITELSVQSHVLLQILQNDYVMYSPHMTMISYYLSLQFCRLHKLLIGTGYILINLINGDLWCWFTWMNFEIYTGKSNKFILKLNLF